MNPSGGVHSALAVLGVHNNKVSLYTGIVSSNADVVVTFNVSATLVAEAVDNTAWLTLASDQLLALVLSNDGEQECSFSRIASMLM